MTIDTSEPLHYRVVVGGRLGDRLSDAFEGLAAEFREGETSLTGEFRDEAHLHGLLEQLYDLGIPLISVDPVRGDAGRRT